MNATVAALLREDLRDFAGYKSARSELLEGDVWLNANESAWANPSDADALLRRYPDPQPRALRSVLACLYDVEPAQLLVGRGSDEAIDLLVRALCEPGQDAVVTSPPVFGMYAVSARLQGARLVEVPLLDDEAGFRSDLAAIGDAALSSGAKLVFLCSPANPTGQALAPEDLLALARRLDGRCLVVVDEAYGEYCDQASLADRIDTQPNLAVLRTLSKAHAMAAARIGCLLAAPELIAVLRNCQAPYPLPSPCVQLAMAGLSEPALVQTRSRVLTVRAERERLHHELLGNPAVRRVYPSQGNYLLVRFHDAEAVFQQLLAAGVVVRDMRASPQLGDALRISIGSPQENDALIQALASGRAAA